MSELHWWSNASSLAQCFLKPNMMDGRPGWVRWGAFSSVLPMLSNGIVILLSEASEGDELHHLQARSFPMDSQCPI